MMKDKNLQSQYKYMSEVDVGAKYSSSPVIASDEGVLGGCPRVGGTRIRVSDVVVKYRSGLSPEELTEIFEGLDLSDVYGALSFYHSNKVLIDEEVENRRQRLEEAKNQQ